MLEKIINASVQESTVVILLGFVFGDTVNWPSTIEIFVSRSVCKSWLVQYDLWNNFFLQWSGEQNYQLSEMLIRSVGFVAIADDNMLLAGTGICWLTGVEMVTSGTDISTVCTGALGVDKTSCGCGWVFELRLSLEAAGLDDAYGDDEFLFDSCLQHFKAEGTLRL